ncbi:serine protease inhibitor Kazal-type 9-like [Notamacropus eugenii]|uniref:serine protease inhibitor Kazal-type 9-like n=1 Tax=Notamacropus eugenii TaxID=9315 RepID=UPI003B670841
MKVAAACVFLMLALMPIFNVESAYRKRVDCSMFRDKPPVEPKDCMDVYDPICASDGKTYPNACVYCTAHKKSNKKIKQVHLGKC